ncbi:hypothetical protein ABPG75_005633 [Micractinium tetrahymenae]
MASTMRAQCLAPLLLAAMFASCLAPTAARVASDYRKASRDPPVSRPPQFILFSHDDDMVTEATKYVFDVSDSFRNPNGCKLPVTWFACTKGCDFSCSTAVKLWKKGHEVATHTVHHYDMRDMSYSQVSKEVLGARDTLVGCGIPLSELRGFRTPFLSDSPTIRKVLYDNGFRFDSTIGVEGGRNKLWPATMEKGVPYDCDVGGNDCSSSERYPGMWEVPLYQMAGSENIMDYCTDSSSSDPIDGCSAYDVLKKEFDATYTSNRGPVTIGVHSIATGYLQSSTYRKEIKQFFDYALSFEDVWVVTISQFLDWMEKPVPANKMKQFMSKYTCPSSS